MTALTFRTVVWLVFATLVSTAATTQDLKLKRIKNQRRVSEDSSAQINSRQLFGEDIPKHRPLSGNYWADYEGFPNLEGRMYPPKLQSQVSFTNDHNFVYTGNDAARIFEYPTTFVPYSRPTPKSMDWSFSRVEGRHSKSSDGFHKISKAFEGFPKFFKTSEGFHKIPKISEGFHKISQSSEGFHKISKSSEGFHKISKSSEGFHKISSAGFHKTLKSDGFHKISKDSDELHRSLKKTAKRVDSGEIVTMQFDFVSDPIAHRSGRQGEPEKSSSSLGKFVRGMFSRLSTHFMKSRKGQVRSIPINKLSQRRIDGSHGNKHGRLPIGLKFSYEQPIDKH